MKRIVAVTIVVMLVVAGWALYQGVAPSTVHLQPATSLASLMPQNAVLFLEAKDFGSMLREWNSSPEKQTWLTTDNHEVFSRSRLFLRLQQAQSEFASAAGVTPDMSFLGEVAGGQSALAVYDIGKLEFLYITRIAPDSALKSGIWQQRGQFETREVDGRKFYVRTDAQSERVVAFALDGDYMILGTREDLVAGALSLLSGKKEAALSGQGWFVDALKAAKDPGELRLVVHLAEVTRTPQFRTYWIQQNITELRQYESSVSDLFRASDVYREERVLLMKSAPEVIANAANGATQAAQLMRLVPPEAGFYRALAAPPVEDSVALLEEKVLTPRLGPTPVSKLAPGAPIGDQAVGSASQLDVRIDTPPTVNATKPCAVGDEALKELIRQANVSAALEIHNSEAAEDGVFVRLRSAVVLRAATDWNEQAVLLAMQRTVSPGLTASSLGVEWKKAGAGIQSYYELDGLAKICVAVRGKELFVSNDRAALAGILERTSQSVVVEPAICYSGFDHSRERQSFVQLTSMVDRPSRSGAVGYGNRTPQFLSENIASLSKTLAGVKSESVVTRQNGALETQSVRYEWVR